MKKCIFTFIILICYTAVKLNGGKVLTLTAEFHFCGEVNDFTGSSKGDNSLIYETT